MTKSILVIGAGLAGAVYARTVAEAGYHVEVIDRRPHIAGNAYDEVDPNGVRVHRYGPHLFHTANQRVLSWIARFADWTSYTHRVRALLPDGRLVPLPINLDTMNAVFGTSLDSEEQAKRHLASVAVMTAGSDNAASYLASKVGFELRDLFFRPYTRKMWNMHLEELDASVVKRLPLRYDRRDTYFADGEIQLMPREGYTAFVESILDHRNIDVSVATPFEVSMLNEVRHCFASLPIDEFYDFREGPLPYRSIRFHHRSEAISELAGPWEEKGCADFSVINFTDDSPHTRETAWHRMPHHLQRETGFVTITREEPCDYRDNNMERYYPVKSADGINEEIYARYKKLSQKDSDRITFIGRCGTYRYLDMDQVINQSLIGAERWIGLDANSRTAA